MAMNNFKFNEASQISALGSYITSPRCFLRRSGSDGFYPFFVERDSIGRLIGAADEKPPSPKLRTKAISHTQDFVPKSPATKKQAQPTNDARSKLYLKALIGDVYQSPRNPSRQNNLSNPESILAIRSETTSPVNPLNSRFLPEIKRELDLTSLVHFGKKKPNHGSKGLPQGSKFKLVSKERAMHSVQPTIGSYDPEKASEILRKKSPRALILKKHEPKKSLELSPANLKPVQPNSYKTDSTHQLSSPERELLRILHNNDYTHKTKGAASHNFFKFSIKPIEDDPELMKFNTTMLRGMDKMKKDLARLKLKVGAIGIRPINYYEDNHIY